MAISEVGTLVAGLLRYYYSRCAMKKKTARRISAKPKPKRVAPPSAARYFVEVLPIGERKGSLDDKHLRFVRRVLFLARRWRNLMDEALRGNGASHARWITLLWVDLLDGGANHRELAERVGVELPTLIRLLNRLEAEGIVKRRSLHDRGMSKSVEMTARGRADLKKMTEIVRRARTEFLRDVDEQKLSDALELFDTLLAKYATVLDWSDRERPL